MVLETLNMVYPSNAVHQHLVAARMTDDASVLIFIFQLWKLRRQYQYTYDNSIV